jgi:hypothetical protein
MGKRTQIASAPVTGIRTVLSILVSVSKCGQERQGHAPWREQPFLVHRTVTSHSPKSNPRNDLPDPPWPPPFLNLRPEVQETSVSHNSYISIKLFLDPFLWVVCLVERSDTEDLSCGWTLDQFSVAVCSSMSTPDPALAFFHNAMILSIAKKPTLKSLRVGYVHVAPLVNNAMSICVLSPNHLLTLLHPHLLQSIDSSRL